MQVYLFQSLNQSIKAVTKNTTDVLREMAIKLNEAESLAVDQILKKSMTMKWEGTSIDNNSIVFL